MEDDKRIQTTPFMEAGSDYQQHHEDDNNPLNIIGGEKNQALKHREIQKIDLRIENDFCCYQTLMIVGLAFGVLGIISYIFYMMDGQFELFGLFLASFKAFTYYNGF
mmetsp:Transcript_4206/g.3541  ORF Transcript_4206/g.3541 Transcript_4206/m.3541 type:complete len:107 (+) Transcript_4206:46-366(+)